MESEGDVSISLLNAIGQEVFYSNDTYKSGVHSVKIDLTDLKLVSTSTLFHQKTSQTQKTCGKITTGSIQNKKGCL